MKGAIQMSNLENYMKQQAIFCEQNDSISKNLYSEYGVKRGLRDEKGQGVLTGLTNISDIKAFEYRDGVKSPCDGELSYLCHHNNRQPSLSANHHLKVHNSYAVPV